MRSRPLVLAAAAVSLAAGAAVAVVSSPAAASTSSAARAYHAISPTRVLDTRKSHAVGAHGTVTFLARGTHGIPSSATAVVVNVTVTAPRASGYITAYADKTRRPTASNLNFVKGLTVPNLVLAPIGTDGRVALYNGAQGSVQLVADVFGYLSPLAASANQQGALATVTPTRLLDTRTSRAVAAGRAVTVTVSGRASVPAGVSAVLLNVTVTQPTAAGYITAYANGSSRPTASNLNFSKGQTVPNLVLAPVGSDGKVALYNGSRGSVQLVADVQGYVLGDDPISAGALGALRPARLLDTRHTHAIGAHQTYTLSVSGHGGVPLARVGAVVLNVTVTQPTASGYLTVYSGSRPATSNLNFRKGLTVPNLVFAPAGSGKVTFYNGSSGTVQVVADVAGYVQASTLPAPHVSTSRYVRNITATSPADALAAEGRADASSELVLLHIGAQTVTDLPTPGVVLSATKIRLTYPALVQKLSGYLDGMSAGLAAGHTVTVVVGTNNDGDFTTYPADRRGSDWAANVIAPLQAHVAGTQITVWGGNDIEAGFAGTEAQAEQWEKSYLANPEVGTLVFNGSADGCSATYGATGGTCNHGWTQAQYYRMAHGLDPSRIRVLPQVYYPAQAVQWANINATGGGKLVFAGALTEHAAHPATFAPLAGWSALWHALGTVVSTPSIPVVTDLRIDG